MRKSLKAISIAMILIMMLSLMTSVAFGVTWEFETSGQGKNPFTPRGYLVDTGKGQQWLSSQYSNDGEVIKWTGTTNGVDYLTANSSYKFYAMTDRNPTPGKNYLVAWKDGKKISGFGDMAGTPGRGEAVDPSGNGTCWVIPIEGFKLEAGCFYEFAFYRGMQANNGITLVLSEDGKGYIQNPETTAEKAKYNRDKYEEYQFIASYEKNTDSEGNHSYFNFHYVPMRFSVQTYADMSIWNDAAKQAQDFLDSVTSSDLSSGKYSRQNISNLKSMKENYQKKADTTVKKQLQAASEKNQKSMANDLLAMLKKAMTEKAAAADMKALEKKIKEAETLYSQVKGKTGTKTGEYGSLEVQALSDEIGKAKKLDKFNPQSTIDAEVQALGDAIIEVKASIVQEAVRIFTDKATGIRVIVPADALPAKVSLIVRRLDVDSRAYKNMKKNLSNTETKDILYDIQFYSSGYKVGPTKSVEVEMPVIDSMDGMTVTVSKVSSKGELTRITAAETNGVKVFNTGSLGQFAMTAHEKTDAEKKALKNAKNAKTMTIIKQSPKSIKSDNKTKERELQKTRTKKEEFKDPSNENVKKQKNDAKFNNDVTREADPKYAIFAAIVLAAVALLIGVRALLGVRRKKDGTEK